MRKSMCLVVFRNKSREIYCVAALFRNMRVLFSCHVGCSGTKASSLPPVFQPRKQSVSVTVCVEARHLELEILPSELKHKSVKADMDREAHRCPDHRPGSFQTPPITPRASLVRMWSGGWVHDASNRPGDRNTTLFGPQVLSGLIRS